MCAEMCDMAVSASSNSTRRLLPRTMEAWLFSTIPSVVPTRIILSVECVLACGRRLGNEVGGALAMGHVRRCRFKLADFMRPAALPDKY